jgi:hypothetical protein
MTIRAAEEDRNRYFRTIAREFLKRRGAPFFLSPRDAEIISGWERRGIPLSVVLEGIERAFERTKPGRPDTGKILSLAFCAPKVERAFDIQREKTVGGRRRVTSTADKKRPAAHEAERFLADLPNRFSRLATLYREGLEILSRTEVDEEALEALDDRADEILREAATPEEKAEAAADMAADRSVDRDGDSPGISLRAALMMRRRYRVPYLALFHY